MNDNTPKPATPSSVPTASYHAPIGPTRLPGDSPPTENGSAPSAFMRVELNDAVPQFIGDYIILRVLGQGGMGTVYLAKDVRLGRQVAIKTMKPELASPDNRERFIREAKAAGAVEHDNIVPIWHVGEAADGSPFIAMPFLQGEMLESRLKREPVTPLGILLKVALDVAEGLAAAHARGLIHRDIKPANVWLEGDPAAPKVGQQIRRCKILDFGLARTMDSTAIQLTSSGVLLGTPAYMAPEQARGERVDHRTDLFSLGVMLYRMGTGRLPFTGPSVMAVLTALATVNPPPTRTQNPKVPLDLSDLVKELMKKDPHERPRSAAEVRVRVMRIFKDLQAVKTAPPPLPPAPVGITSTLAVPKGGSDAPPGGSAAEGKARVPALRRTLTRRAVLASAVAAGIGSCAGGLWWMTAKDSSKGNPREAAKPPPRELLARPPLSPEPKNWPAGLAKPILNSIGMRFSRIPPGKFMRGSPDTDEFGTPDERPRREIEIGKEYCIGIYEVTHAEYRRIMGGALTSNLRGEFLPVEHVLYKDAEEFCKKLTMMEEEKVAGRLYRLPTEAEWEYACRGGGSSYQAYHFGHTLTPAQANFSDSKIGKTTVVGSYPPNAFGLYDMHGNVWEWCADWYDSGYYVKGEIKDPLGPLNGTAKVLRGGSWYHGPENCRGASRYRRDSTALEDGRCGFRICFNWTS